MNAIQISRDVVLEPTADRLTAKLTVKDTTWYRHLVQLHKAKGGQLFKFYAATLAISLFVILLSGFVMAWQVPKYRRMAIVCSATGIGVFLLMMWLKGLEWTFLPETAGLLLVTLSVGALAATRVTFRLYMVPLIALLFPLSVGVVALLRAALA